MNPETIIPVLFILLVLAFMFAIVRSGRDIK